MCIKIEEVSHINDENKTCVMKLKIITGLKIEQYRPFYGGGRFIWNVRLNYQSKISNTDFIIHNDQVKDFLRLKKGDIIYVYCLFDEKSKDEDENEKAHYMIINFSQTEFFHFGLLYNYCCSNDNIRAFAYIAVYMFLIAAAFAIVFYHSSFSVEAGNERYKNVTENHFEDINYVIYCVDRVLYNFPFLPQNMNETCNKWIFPYSSK